MMQKFWNWVSRNFNTRGTLAVTVTGTVCYMAAMEIAIPSELWLISTSVLGFYFGTKTMVGTVRARGG